MNDLAPRPQNAVVWFKSLLSTMLDQRDIPLPSNVSPDAFRNAAVVAVSDNPKILSCDEASIFKAIRRLASAGLVPDGREAALVPFKTKINGSFVDVCQAMPMVFGLIKSARRSGTVKDIRAHIVYQREVDEGRFTYVVGDEESLEHKPILFGDRGPAVGAYAIATLIDGMLVREFMAAEDIDKVRRAGASQKIFERGKAPRVSDEPRGIWADWSEEMWKKTVIRRLCKRLDLSAEDMRHIMSEPDQEPMRDVTPKGEETAAAADQEKPKQTAAARIAALVDPDVDDAETDEAETEDEPAGDDEKKPEQDEGGTADAAQAEGDAAEDGAPAANSDEDSAGEAGETGESPADRDTPDPTEEEVDRATAAGREACRKRIPIKAVPKEIAANEDLAKAWRRGWTVEDKEQAAAAKAG